MPVNNVREYFRVIRFSPNDLNAYMGGSTARVTGQTPAAYAIRAMGERPEPMNLSLLSDAEVRSFLLPQADEKGKRSTGQSGEINPETGKPLGPCERIINGKVYTATDCAEGVLGTPGSRRVGEAIDKATGGILSTLNNAGPLSLRDIGLGLLGVVVVGIGLWAILR